VLTSFQILLSIYTSTNLPAGRQRLSQVIQVSGFNSHCYTNMFFQKRPIRVSSSKQICHTKADYSEKFEIWTTAHPPRDTVLDAFRTLTHSWNGIICSMFGERSPCERRLIISRAISGWNKVLSRESTTVSRNWQLCVLLHDNLLLLKCYLQFTNIIITIIQ